MADFDSDAFVFFGATGDLAHKQIFPSLQGLINSRRRFQSADRRRRQSRLESGSTQSARQRQP